MHRALQILGARNREQVLELIKELGLYTMFLPEELIQSSVLPPGAARWAQSIFRFLAPLPL